MTISFQAAGNLHHAQLKFDFSKNHLKASFFYEKQKQKSKFSEKQKSIKLIKYL